MPTLQAASQEDELVDSYRQADTSPVGCRELAHLAGCEHCLSILERTLGIDDRDGPLDGPFDGNQIRSKKVQGGSMRPCAWCTGGASSFSSGVPRFWLFAVDGRVVAFHAIEALAIRCRLAWTLLRQCDLSKSSTNSAIAWHTSRSKLNLVQFRESRIRNRSCSATSAGCGSMFALTALASMPKWTMSIPLLRP